MVICWEFIHLFHSRAELGDFLKILVEKLDTDGTLIITNIRQKSYVPPQEQIWAKECLQDLNLKVESSYVEFEGVRVPFERRLNFKYPILVAKKQSVY